MIDTNEYINWAKSKSDLPLYMQPWWLDIVCEEKGWDAVIDKNEDGTILSALAFHYGYRSGINTLTVPPLTQFTGIWLDESLLLENSAPWDSSKCYDSISRIIDKIPSRPIQTISLGPKLPTWLPFYWKGFRQTTRYTYQINFSESGDNFRDFYHRVVRENLKKANKFCSISISDDSNLMFDFIQKTFERKGNTVPYSRNLFLSLDKELLSKNQRTIYQANDELGNIHGMLYVIWDSSTTYYLASGIDPDKKRSQSITLLMDRAISDSFDRSQIFDFEGSMIQGVESFFRSFGGKPVSYHKLTRFRNRFWETVQVWFGK
jgi:hypothetical protein